MPSLPHPNNGQSKRARSAGANSLAPTARSRARPRVMDAMVCARSTGAKRIAPRRRASNGCNHAAESGAPNVHLSGAVEGPVDDFPCQPGAVRCLAWRRGPRRRRLGLTSCPRCGNRVCAHRDRRRARGRRIASPGEADSFPTALVRNRRRRRASASR